MSSGNTFTGISYTRDFLHHQPPSDYSYNPSSPSAPSVALGLRDSTDRLVAAIETIESLSLHRRCIKSACQPAQDHEILAVHTTEYYEKLKRLNNLPQSRRTALLLQNKESFYMNDFTLSCARQAAGSVVSMCNQVHSGRLKNGLCLVRPPGNLATSSTGNGCCLLNNVAIGAQQLKRLNFKRILIVDIDVHASVGTSKIFESDDSVMVISIHHGGENFYPNSEKTWKVKCNDTGVGKGKGYNVNVAFPTGQINSSDLIQAVTSVVLPLGSEFRPDMILVSSGFGMASNDCGQCMVEPLAFGHVVHLLMKLTCGRVICVTEGGYNPRVFGECCEKVLDSLLEDYKPAMKINKSMASPHTKAVSLRLLERMKSKSPTKKKMAFSPDSAAASTGGSVGSANSSDYSVSTTGSASAPGSSPGASTTSPKQKKKRESLLMKATTFMKPEKKDDIIKKGWMMKQGHFRKSWRKRFFVLQPGLISYYGKESGLTANDGEGADLKGQIALYGAVVDTLKDKPALKTLSGKKNVNNCLYIVGRAGEKDFVIEAADEEEALEWCEAIRAEIHSCNDRKIRVSFGDVTTSLPASPFPPASVEGVSAIYEACKALRPHWKSMGTSIEKLEGISGLGDDGELDFADAERAPSDMFEVLGSSRDRLSFSNGRLSPTGSVSASPRAWSPSLGGDSPVPGGVIGRLSPIPLMASAASQRVVRKPAALKAVLKTLTIIIVFMFGRICVNGVGSGSAAGSGIDMDIVAEDLLSVEIDIDGNVRTTEGIDAVGNDNGTAEV
ncbi:hypothetical protein TrVE_jg12842 [Triparma verrucosa]|uniref:histone deacetylase n=1 Tax=Triparma verrucosa TaxID=1606542 RepID=A0A9W7F909_9STRA|nr:hypothetical protein TrVE_jg12842 [Triparma verrucosa]